VHVPSLMDMVRRLVPWIITDKDATEFDTPFAAMDDGLPLRGDRDLAGERPLRGELFSTEQLQRHARTVASSHRLTRHRTSGGLLTRLADNERVLVETYELLAVATRRGRRIAPASEWLLDNFYLLEEQIHSTRRLLPRSYLDQLPALAADCPRTYRIAMELIAHTDGRVEAAALDAFIAAYQSVCPLALGELWAMPLMLRLALIENLRRVAQRLATARYQRDIAADWSDRMLEAAEKRPADLVTVLADMTRASPPLSGAFLAEFTRTLQGHSPAFTLAGTWLEHCLAGRGLSIEQMVLAEGQAQAADQVSVGNSIGSLRFLAVHDWRDFVASHSIVEQTLVNDPAAVYGRTDFATRNRYRSCVETIARRTGRAEEEVAQRIVALAHESSVAGAQTSPSRESHVGYWLVDAGRDRLMQDLGCRFVGVAAWFAPWRACIAAAQQSTLGLLLAATTMLTAAGVLVFLEAAGPAGRSWLLAVPLLLVALHLAVGLVTWVATLVVRPHPLPRLDFRDGIPPEQRTLVAVPAMLTDPATVDRLLEGLEIRFLANRDPHLHFALLSDLPDAAVETQPADEPLIRQAVAGIDVLNRRYAADRHDHFLLLHRSRAWNARDGVWMGRERKRGKLADLNAVLRGAALTGPAGRFSHVAGNGEFLPRVRSVITLDADTDLPRDAAREMVGAMAHILNRPVPHPTLPRIAAGHGIIQPRVAVSLPSAQRSRFSRLTSGTPGIDPYTRVVSNLYQDLFDEGSFVGKGIYDVDAFEHCCGFFPEHTILSHDLLEGCHCRSGLESDVVLHEDHPSSYLADARRRHRWIRGDWQILWWLLPRVPNHGVAAVKNPLSSLSQWKILDNLRRSLVPPAMLGLLVGAWLSGSLRLAMAAAGLVVLAAFLPPLLACLLDFLRKPHDVPLTTHLLEAARSATRPLMQGLLQLAMLPYEAGLAIDAIARTLVRMLLTHRRLLEWRTAADTERTAADDLPGFIRAVGVSPLTAALLAAILIASGRPDMLVAASPWLLAWLLAPLVAWWISLPLPQRTARLSAPDQQFLATAGRRTWRYFEEYVTAHTNWLPPDNVQMNGELVVAARTSPTNIAMALLSDLAACDFGWCSVSRLVGRIGHTFDTLGSLERHRGHLLNWYDIHTLAPLPPRYVSTVDSGNFVGSLLVLAGGLDELRDAAVLPPRLFAGLEDTLRVLAEYHHGSNAGHGRQPAAAACWPGLPDGLLREPVTVARAAAVLPRLIAAGAAARGHLADADAECRWWTEAVIHAAADQLADLHHLAPWTTLPPPPEHFWQRVAAQSHPRAARLRGMLDHLNGSPTLREIVSLPETVLPLVEEVARANDTNHSVDAPACSRWLRLLHASLESAAIHASERRDELGQLAAASRALTDIDFRFLYDPSRRLFAIGFNATEHRLDAGYYDLLASEARLASYVLVARRQLDQDHWFALGRLLTTADGAPTLLSWSGSMFEYLMPMLVMPSWSGTLLDHSCRAAVHRQIGYAAHRGVPWGISESGYNARDVQMNYQYRAFGVPGLGLKRGLADDIVIAPYASALALLVAPRAACGNLQRIAADGGMGTCGFIEAIDYTPSRRVPASSGNTLLDSAETEAAVGGAAGFAGGVPVRQFMAHHQGMSLLAFASVLLDSPMQRRFMADPSLKSATLLLQERIPKLTVTVFPHTGEATTARGIPAAQANAIRVVTDFDGPAPEVHLLSNGRYHVAISAAGGGWSRWRGLAVTRWREDATRDHWGQFCYLRDLDSGVVWSNTWQPTTRGGRRGEAVFMQSRAEFRRVDEQIEAHTLVSVSTEDDVELRRLSLTNRSERRRSIEVTTYTEVALAPQGQDESHPAFSNLFVETEILAGRPALLATRRPRSPDERPPWLLHVVTGSCATEDCAHAVGKPSFETDRRVFLGRGRTPRDPAACTSESQHRKTLSGTTGATLDPVVSIRRTVVLEPGETVRLDIVTGIAESREQAAEIAVKYSDPCLADRIIELAWTRGAIMLQQLAISEQEAQAYGRLAGALVHASRLRRTSPAVIARNRRGQSGLWGHGISGDLPLVLVRIRDRHQLELVQQAIRAHGWWRMHGLDVDLVIWNEDDSVYRQVLHESILDLVSASPEAGLIDRPGGIFVRRGEQLSEEDRGLLQASARVMLTDEAGTLVEQVERRGRSEIMIPPLKPRRRLAPPASTTSATEREPGPPPAELHAFNGLGGFTADGGEYVIHLRPGVCTPAPWVNCLANPRIGTLVSESGNACTWVDNSHEFRLTPWTNDPVSDIGGEAIYIRDEDTGRFWSPTPQPTRGRGTYTVRHGIGSTVFEHADDGLASELTLFVAEHEPVKFVRLTIANTSGRPRALSITGYWEWVLGELRTRSLMHVVTEVDHLTGALFARNAFTNEFATMVAFVDTSEVARTVTGDRTEFIGRNGSLSAPAALERMRLSGRVGAGFDPCAAMQVQVLLDDGEQRTVVFTLGAAQGVADAQRLVQQFRGELAAEREFAAMRTGWQRQLSAVQIESPEPAVDALVNHWLLYQVVSCRLWGRTSLYQSSGAYGFRDQLQDAMALVHAAPELLREHLLRAAGRQFEEGDVQHWWHPPAGRGIRTHCSDDFLWLPAAVIRYVQATGDTGVLDEPVPFLHGRPPRADEESFYELPQSGPATAPLYDHCVRAIERGLHFGAHGLPLFGGGDWNDGMNLVGHKGRGESVWLAFFLYDVLSRFADVAERHGDVVMADRCSIEAGRLRGNVDDTAWDGSWYRRGTFDDGLPLGSISSAECRIDSVSQSWAVLSAAAPQARAAEAMASVDALLVSRPDRLVKLLTPPFDTAPVEPGYIKGYPPGVRENGGQYTHAAAWTAMAFAALGDHARAWELFRLINPVSHGDTPEAIATYRVEPYVVAADIYAVAPHTGRGGWTWYTGSASWMYRLLVESLLGIEKEGTVLRLSPHPPRDWPCYTIRYRYYSTLYRITVHHPGHGVREPGPIRTMVVDGVPQADHAIPLVDDRHEHVIEIELA
jgi:cyclic beta-1,2-glucan synthetase